MNGSHDLVAMEEAPYDSEQILQELLAKHPDLLAGEQIDSDKPRRWLLVSREMAVPDEDDGAARWSLDHLFLDQDAIPTLVEVKRSNDSRIRRKVVGQMLDYAANAVVYWPVEEIKSKFEARCERARENPEDVLGEFLDEESNPEEFWQRVKTNLQAGRIRMVFLADMIPAELRRIVEFLNEQMDPAEVLALEVKQFVGTGMKTLVPRVLGQTETARQKKASGTASNKQWDETSFMAELRRNNGEIVETVTKELLDWITPHVNRIWWGQGSKEGGIVPIIENGAKKYHICRMASQGWIAFRLDWLYKKPPFNDEVVRRELLAMINQITDVQFGEEVLTKRARIPLEKLTNPMAMEKLKTALGWLIRQAKQQIAHAT